MLFTYPQILLYLTGPTAHSTLGFANGFIYNISNVATSTNYVGKNEIIEKPLSSVVTSILYGIYFGWISNYIGESTPQCIKICLPTLLIGVSSFHIFNALRIMCIKNK